MIIPCRGILVQRDYYRRLKIRNLHPTLQGSRSERPLTHANKKCHPPLLPIWMRSCVSGYKELTNKVCFSNITSCFVLPKATLSKPFYINISGVLLVPTENHCLTRESSPHGLMFQAILWTPFGSDCPLYPCQFTVNVYWKCHCTFSFERMWVFFFFSPVFIRACSAMHLSILIQVYKDLFSIV